MKTKILLLIVTGLLLKAKIAVGDEGQMPLSVALFEFDSPYKVMRHDVSDLLLAQLSSDPRVMLVERSDLKRALSEQALGISGTVTADTAAKIGQLTGAKVLVTGRVFKVGGEWTISTRIIGTETGRVFPEVTQGARSNLFNITSNLSQRIVQTITIQTTNLVSDPALTHEERIARIVKRITGKNRPSVQITVRNVAGDAAKRNHTTETELGRILQSAGFRIVAENSEQKPDVLITGNAVTSNGARYGALYSCSARLEIEALERPGHKNLATDRQVSVAVDLDKATARVLALENAADALAERLLPLLAE